MLTAIGRLLGLFVMLIGFAVVALGVYVGIWEMLVGGIVQIIDQCKAPTTDAGTIAWAIVKIIFCKLPIIVGIFIGFALVGVGGTALFKKDRY
jgi:hypothetical protein